MTPAEHLAEQQRIGDRLRLERAWGHCYIIWFERPWWWAQRRDNGAQVKAPTPRELRDAIRDDHAEKPVPKEFRTPEAD